MAIDTWFLSAGERDNPFTRLTYRRGGASWSSGNDVRALVHGASYVARLHEVVEQMRAEDLLLFTDWRGDAEERLAEDGPGIGDLLAGVAARGVLVRGLFWRSHSDALHLSEGDNRRFAQQIRRAGGQVILDERVAPTRRRPRGPSPSSASRTSTCGPPTSCAASRTPCEPSPACAC